MICRVPDCGRPHAARGLCTLHYDRLRQHLTGWKEAEDHSVPLRIPEDPSYCTCPDHPSRTLDSLGECNICGRKPKERMTWWRHENGFPALRIEQSS